MACGCLKVSAAVMANLRAGRLRAAASEVASAGTELVQTAFGVHKPPIDAQSAMYTPAKNPLAGTKTQD
jgi:hypothetical protein